MYKKGSFMVLLLFILVGCSNFTGKDALLKEVAEAEHLVNDENWEEVSGKITTLNDLFYEHLWKIQLIGDEGEYERLHESISRLFISIEEKDKAEAKLELATIKALIQDIYSL
ncbi:DUF4363 family protein [Oceanobacillus piezotolerans]|uniref:DUF4363 family protein n=1 Tax=Oceanobacillus piezotolerans TaxID=2448030 RepID=A0A498DL15_9BACI|nr:DUF4363 family protein [Oceanobacillus piezotolerans]RLL43669.1 DUF4363 family protein [Oceanobacillus piezotolerans]